MSKANPTRPNAPEDEARVGDSSDAPTGLVRAPRDPRTEQALDNVGVDDAADLLDVELDDQPGDQFDGPSFADDVRSDGDDDERNERR